MNTESNNSEMEVGSNELDILSMLIGDDEEKWRNTRGQLELVNQCIQKGETPKDILKNHFKVNINHLSDDALEHWSIILHLIMEGSQRKRIENINTFKQACDLIRDSKNIIVLTGAGISVPCGVPDFRSRNGIYARLAVDFPDLDEPQSMFDIHYFSKNPKPFFKFAKEIYPGKFTPSLGHKFIKLLEDKNKLLRNYTQNIDTLEQVAGIKNIIHCHGSFAFATCMRCEYKVNGDAIENDVLNQRIPICPSCTSEEEKDQEAFLRSLENRAEIDTDIPIMKPDVVFFGEGLPKDFHSKLSEDKDKADLLIVIGSSLKVRPVAHIPGCLPPDIPQILINKETLTSHGFDVELLGDCDTIVTEICKYLHWDEFPSNSSGDFVEKSICDMKQDIDTILADSMDKNSESNEISQDKDKSEESINDKETYKLLNVGDLLNEDLTCIRVPPNKYAFKGAEFVINAFDLDNPDNLFAPITNQYDSSSYDSSESGDSDLDEDDENVGEINDEGNQTQESVNNKPSVESSPECNQSKRQRLSDSKDSEL
nr:sirtuin-1-like protein [Dugesia japonica]